MRLLFVAVLFGALLPACTKADGLVVVTVDSLRPYDPIAALSVTATVSDDGRQVTFKVGDQGPPFAIPPAKTFGIEVPGSYSGTLTVEVSALDAAGAVLATGDGATPLSPSPST